MRIEIQMYVARVGEWVSLPVFYPSTTAAESEARIMRRGRPGDYRCRDASTGRTWDVPPAPPTGAFVRPV